MAGPVSGGVALDAAGLDGGIDEGDALALGVAVLCEVTALGLELGVAVNLEAVGFAHRFEIDFSPKALAGPQPTGVMATSTTPITATVTTVTSTPATICLDRVLLNNCENRLPVAPCQSIADSYL